VGAGLRVGPGQRVSFAAEDERHELMVGRVKLDLVDAVAEAVVRRELGQMPVGLAGEMLHALGSRPQPGALEFAHGVLHGLMTLLDLRRPRFFAPRDRQLIQALRQTSIGLSPRVNFWLAWLGFNLSHSLGLIIFGAGLIWLASVGGHPVISGAGALVGVVYLILALRFWFWRAAMWCGIGALLLALSYVVSQWR
jgi:hypothetical protein